MTRNRFFLTLVAFLLISVVSLSEIASSKRNCQPRQIHLALGDSYYYVSQSMNSTNNLNSLNHAATLIFHTRDFCDQPSVKILSIDKSLQPTRVTNFTASYPHGNYKSHIYVFYIYDLVPETTYDYQISVNGISSQVYSFQIPKPLKICDKDQTTKFLFIGDIDMDRISGHTWARIQSRINSQNFKAYDAFIHLGDLAYNLEDNAGLRGDFFMEYMSQTAAWMPYTVIPGNHEENYNYSNFINRIRMPLWEQTNNHYYSINVGLVHVATFNFDFFTSNPSLRSAMLEWLENDLQRANQVRDRWPWIILINHKPLYCSDLVNYGPECRTYWKDYQEVDHLINKYKVDLYLSGHVHSYERSLPIYQGVIKGYEKVDGDDKYAFFVDPQAPIHIVEAIAGNQETHHLRPCNSIVV